MLQTSSDRCGTLGLFVGCSSCLFENDARMAQNSPRSPFLVGISMFKIS
jgi:hypothetical protein